MIKLVTDENGQEFQNFCLTDFIYGAMQYTRYACYKNHPDSAKFWLAYSEEGVPIGSISNLYGSVILSFVDDEDAILEIAQFLNYIEVDTVWCDNSFLCFFDNELSSYFKVTEKTCFTASTMAANRKIGVLSSRIKLANSDLGEAYRVICEGYGIPQSDDGYNTWLSNVSIRINRANSRMYGIYIGDKMACVGIIGYQHQNGGEISSIVTAPEHRLQGFAKEMTLHLAAVMEQEGKRPFLFCENERLLGLYEPLGFERVGRWINLK